MILKDEGDKPVPQISPKTRRHVLNVSDIEGASSVRSIEHNKSVDHGKSIDSTEFMPILPGYSEHSFDSRRHSFNKRSDSLDKFKRQ